MEHSILVESSVKIGCPVNDLSTTLLDTYAQSAIHGYQHPLLLLHGNIILMLLSMALIEPYASTEVIALQYIWLQHCALVSEIESELSSLLGKEGKIDVSSLTLREKFDTAIAGA